MREISGSDFQKLSTLLQKAIQLEGPSFVLKNLEKCFDSMTVHIEPFNLYGKVSLDQSVVDNVWTFFAHATNVGR